MSGIFFPNNYEFKRFDSVRNIFDPKAISLEIEESFGYIKPHKFNVDFYPLFTKENLQSSFFLTYKNKIIGAIFCVFSEIRIKNNKHAIASLGGIFIKKEHRGLGLFKPFFKKVISEIKTQSTAEFIFLWSENEDLYKKFGFSPMGNTYYEFPGRKNDFQNLNFKKKAISQLNNQQKKQLINLYKNGNVSNHFYRSSASWDSIEKITSINSYFNIDPFGNLKGYFFEGKGMDLMGVIHEFSNDIDTVSAINNHSKLTYQKPTHSDYIVIPSALIKNLRTNNIDYLNEIFCNGVDCV